MIDFTLSDEQRSIAEMVRELMLEQVAPRTREIEDQAEFPAWVAELFRGLDLFAVAVPEEYGGIDGSLVTLCVVVEQVARVSPACSMIVGVQCLGVDAHHPVRQRRAEAGLAAGNSPRVRRWSRSGSPNPTPAPT